MAFNGTNFSFLDNGLPLYIVNSGNTQVPVFSYLWKYKSTSDSISTINGANYFGSSSVRVGDLIAVQATDGVEVLLCNSASPGTISVYPVYEVSGGTDLTFMNTNITF